MNKLDFRTHTDRDAATLSRIECEGGFSIDWLIQNRDNAASLHRLIEDGSLRIDGSGWIRVERPRERGFWDGFWSGLIGWPSV